ncbi:MAG: hypothetical protein M1835_006142 [Candelina submexicana]|nr:MAG: hypothetical protein M1835_006142 [Candelina submexicana]
MGEDRRNGAKRKDDRIIIHFDYDCFYASVFEAENPALRSLPLAVQQKQIIVTCNYEARRRGLHKLQLIKEARKVCPDVIIVLGEDLTRFRNASKALYNFLRAPIWSGKVERLGFDEVFMDVTDMVAYNVELLNRNDLQHSFFQLSRDDPTLGFSYDATSIAGYAYPSTTIGESVCRLPTSSESPADEAEDWLRIRLILGSHLARYLRHQLDEQLGYTSTVGVSTSKLLAKLVGSVNKPKGQTTLMPPYRQDANGLHSNVTTFLDAHDIGRIPGIGFKIAQKIRSHLLGRPGEFDAGLIYGGTKEKVSVGDVRNSPGLDRNRLEVILGGPGAPQGIGTLVWGLINGIDDTEVGKARSVPRQISIEDSYIRLDTMDEVRKELGLLARSLVKRMHMDLLTYDEDDVEDSSQEQVLHGDQHQPTQQPRKKWLAQPRTLRLTTRPRPPVNANGARSRTFNRISRSGPMPNFVLNLDENADSLADKLVTEALVPLFRKLHPEKSGWNLSLVNVAATNMAETAGEGREGAGRDIGRMFKRQETVLKEWRVEDVDIPPLIEHDDGIDRHVEDEGEVSCEMTLERNGTEDAIEPSQESYVDVEDGEWDGDGDLPGAGITCSVCDALMPEWAMTAHRRFHSLEG